jgi:APA family basic amino acid/polyamine antiporter
LILVLSSEFSLPFLLFPFTFSPDNSRVAAPSLSRSLGPLDAAAVVISNVIGVGIFTVPGIVAQMVGHPLWMLAAWLAGGLLAFAGANAYAELAARHPRAGGEYVYLRAGFGPLAAFLTGWTSFIAGFSGAIAAGAVGFAEYFGRYAPAAADTRPLLSVPLYVITLEFSPRALVALVVLFAITAVHIRGLGPGTAMQNTLTVLKFAALVALIGFGFTIGSGSAQNFAAAAAPVRPANWLLALIPVMFTYSGWNAAAYLAEEVREPGRNVPRALALGTAAVVALYLLLNVLYLYALPPEQLAGSIRTGDVAAEALFGVRGAELLTPLILVGLAGSISAMVLAGPRVYFAMARDALFAAAAARIHPRFQTPSVAIAAQSAWSAVLILSGTFDQLLLYTGFAVVLFSGLAVLALFLIRLKGGQSFSSDMEPAERIAGASAPEEKPYRCWGYPVAPAIFVLASFAMCANAIHRDPGPSLAGLALIAAGLPLYWWLRRRI